MVVRSEVQVQAQCTKAARGVQAICLWTADLARSRGYERVWGKESVGLVDEN
jgi:hypothetical protein